MWDWLRRLLGLKPAAEKKTVILTGKVAEPIPPTPLPFTLRARTHDTNSEWPSTEEYARRIKPPSLLELSRRRNPEPSTERKMPKSFANRPGVKQAQANLGKVGYDPKAKMEEDPPRRRRW